MSIRTKRGTKRSVVAIVAATLIASMLALVSTPASAAATVTQKRLSGLDRYATASATAEYSYTNATKTIIASGENYADALAGSALSGALAAPLLLTAKDALPAVTAAAMGRMMGTNKTVYVLGGEAAVSAGVVTTLTGLGYVVTRISGADRYATAAAVAAKIKSVSTIGSMNGKVTCILASGQGYADALSAGPLAHNNKMPILLTEPGALTAATSAAITANGCKQMMIVGGESAVSAAVATAADALTGVNVIRVSGADRYATSVAIADKAWASTATGGLGWAKTHIAIARGDSFADGLAAAQLSTKDAVTPVLLVQADMVPTSIAAAISGKSTTITDLRIVGGTSAIPATVAQSADDSATKAAPTVTITGHTVGSNAITVSYSEKMDDCKDRGDYKLNNAALGVTNSGAIASLADGDAPYAGKVVKVTFGNAANNKFAVGNKVTISNEAAAANLVPDLTYGTQAAGVTGEYYVMDNTTTVLQVLGTTGGTNAQSVVAAAADQDSSAVAALSTTTCTIYLDAPLAAGDVFTASGATGFASPNVAATAASVTVAAVANVAANKPTVTGSCYTGAVDAIVVKYSKPVQGVAIADFTIVGGEALTATGIQPITGAERFRLTVNGTMEGGDTITIGANSVTAQDGTTGPAVATTITCVANATKPAVVSATGVMTHGTAATCSSAAGVDDDFVYTFSKTGIGAGIYGNSYKIQLVNSASGTTAVSTSYNSIAKTLVVSWNDSGAATEAGITAVVAAINADATFGANGSAVVSDTSDTKTLTAGVTITCANGASTVTVTATMNAPYQPAAADIDHTKISLVDGTGLVKRAMGADGTVTGTWNNNAYTSIFKTTFTLGAVTEVLVKGSSSIEFAADAILSLNDVANVKSTAVIN